jgi:hypothetical protein
LPDETPKLNFVGFLIGIELNVTVFDSVFNLDYNFYGRAWVVLEKMLPPVFEKC